MPNPATKKSNRILTLDSRFLYTLYKGYTESTDGSIYASIYNVIRALRNTLYLSDCT